MIVHVRVSSCLFLDNLFNYACMLSSAQGDVHARESVEIAVAAHYIDPPASKTDYLTELLQSLPNWVTAIGWTSTYDSWVY